MCALHQVHALKSFGYNLQVMIKKIKRKWNTLLGLRFFEKHQNTGLPYCIEIKGSGKVNKNVLISGATHGNEPVGMRFAKFLYSTISKGKLSFEGDTLYLMLGNPKAARKDKRYIDYDLNRSFSKERISANPEVCEFSRAKEIMNFFSDKKIDYFIDLHSVSVGDTKLYVINAKDKDLLENIKEYSSMELFFLYHRAHIDGLMVSFFEELGAKGVAIECGSHFNDKAIKTAKKEVLNLLSRLGLLNGKIPQVKASKNKKVYETIDHVKAGPNFKWLLDVKSELPLKKGEAFAKDNKNGAQKAPQNCFLLMPSKKVEATDHDAGFLCIKH